MKKFKTTVNLMPKEMIREGIFLARMKILLIFTALMAITVVIGWTCTSLTTIRYKRQIHLKQKILTTISQSWDKIRGETKSLEEMKKKIQEERSKSEALKNEIGTEKKYSEVLREISNLIPEGVWLTELSLKGVPKNMILKGMAFSNPLAASFLDSLEKSTCFSNVQIGFMQEAPVEEHTVVEFEARCKFNL
jgi:Tfp pilus assembly protein PilN